jgi:cytochrome c biogenesis protein CcmG/thiol:disulfide interchange protein DsbE
MGEIPAPGSTREAASPSRVLLLLSVLFLLLAAGMVVYSLAVRPGLDRGVAPVPIVPPAARVQAPAFELSSLRGPERIRLSEFRGHVVVLNFFASWCGPCELEAADLERAWQANRDRAVVFLGVAVQDTARDARAFLSKHRVSYPAVFDERGDTFTRYRVTGIPTTIVVDPEGRTAARHAGIFVGDEGVAALQELVEGARRTR